MDAPLRIRYGNGQNEVLIGDRVRVRLFLILHRTARVSYVPGISPLHREMEHDGIRLVGVTFDDGGSAGFWVEPSTALLIKTVKFLGCDDSPAPELPAEEDWK